MVRAEAKRGLGNREDPLRRKSISTLAVLIFESEEFLAYSVFYTVKQILEVCKIEFEVGIFTITPPLTNIS